MFGVDVQSLLPNSSSPIYGAHNADNNQNHTRQNVKNARMPKPTGFGLGSRVRPSCAARITTSSGPIPIQRSTKPIHKKRDTRLLVAAAISLIFANYPSNETKLSRG